MASGRANAWKLGLFVVTAVLIGIAALIWLGASRLRRESIEVIAFFDETVDGLDPGSPVKYLGVTIGRVEDITVAGDARHVKVSMEVYLDELRRLGLPSELPDASALTDSGLRIQLVSSVLTGVSFLEGCFFDPKLYPIEDYPFEVPVNTMYTVPSTMKQLETGLVEAMRSIPKVVEQASSILERFDSSIDDMQLGNLSAQAVDLMASLQDRLDRLEELPLLAEGSSAMIELRETLVEVRAALRDAKLPGMSDSLRSMGAEVGGAAHSVADLSEDLRAEMIYLREALQRLGSLADSLERDPGALLYGKTPQDRPK